MHHGARTPADPGLGLTRRQVGRLLLGMVATLGVLASPDGVRGTATRRHRHTTARDHDREERPQGKRPGGTLPPGERPPGGKNDPPKRDRGHNRGKGHDSRRDEPSRRDERTPEDLLPGVDDGSSSALDAEELALLGMINDYRAANGRTPLIHQAHLGAAAEAHASDMATHNIIGHIGNNGSDPAWRIEQAGYDYAWSGENLFWGNGAARAAVAWWKGSPEHHDNLLFAHFTEIGISRAYNPGSAYGWYWTTTFGSRAIVEREAAPRPKRRH